MSIVQFEVFSTINCRELVCIGSGLNCWLPVVHFKPIIHVINSTKEQNRSASFSNNCFRPINTNGLKFKGKPPPLEEIVVELSKVIFERKVCVSGNEAWGNEKIKLKICQIF